MRRFIDVCPLLIRHSVRHLENHQWQTWLTIIGIMLGVTIVVAVDLANSSAKKAFTLSLNTVAGNATHQLSAGPSGIDEQLYPRLRRELGLQHLAPRISDYVKVKGRTLSLIGIDPITSTIHIPSQSQYILKNTAYGIRNIITDNNTAFILEPNTVMLSSRTANQLQLSLGDAVTLSHRSNLHTIKVIGIFDSNNPAATEGLLFADIAVAQEILSRIGKLDRIDLSLSAIEHERLTAWLAELQQPNIKLESSTGRHNSLLQMTAAFHTNLTAMSLLALLIGALLIYNTMTFSVLRRRHTLGTLRAIGVSRAEIFKLILVEAFGMALLGTLGGLILGIILGQGLVQLVLRTINDLYYVVNVTEYFISPLSLIKGTAIGLMMSLVAASFPAWEATKTLPIGVQQRSSIEKKTRTRLPQLLLIGMALMLIGHYLVNDENGSLLIGFTALACFVFGFTLAVPQILLWMIKALLLLNSRFSNTIRMILRGISVGISRTGMAIAALTLAVSVTIGVGIMIDSFRETVSTWLNQTLSGDIYVSIAGRSSARTNPGLPASFIKDLQQLPGIIRINTSRMIKVDTEMGLVRLMALTVSNNSPLNRIPPNEIPTKDMPASKVSTPEMLISDKYKSVNIKQAVHNSQQLFEQGNGIFISEPMAYHNKIQLNTQLEIHTQVGNQSFRVLGIFYDYTSSHGLMAIHRKLYEQYWNDKEISRLSIYRNKNHDQSTLLKAIRERAAQEKMEILVYSSEEIRQRSITMFDRTFTITQVLRLLAVMVAFMAILSALMALHLERNKEFAILRTTGMTPKRLSLMIISQSALMGLLAGVLAIPLGVLMADLLIEVINRRSFGWSMQKILPYPVLFEAIALATTAALLAGIYPAFKAATCSPALALREE